MNTTEKDSLAGTDSIVAELITLHLARAQKGAEKYGVTLDRTDLTEEQWEQHLLEELMDGALYLLRWRKQRAEGDKRLCDFMNNREAKLEARIAELEEENALLKSLVDTCENCGGEADAGWRDASKEKPEAMKNVLTIVREIGFAGSVTDTLECGFWEPGCGWFIGAGWQDEAQVLHWRELPAPPKGEEGE